MASGEIKREPQFVVKNYTVTTGSSLHYSWYYADFYIGTQDEVNKLIDIQLGDASYNREVIVSFPRSLAEINQSARVYSNMANATVQVQAIFYL